MQNLIRLHKEVSSNELLCKTKIWKPVHKVKVTVKGSKDKWCLIDYSKTKKQIGSNFKESLNIMIRCFLSKFLVP